MNQKVLLGCVLLAICAMCGPQFVHAWGPDGHKIVAQIAQQFMSPIAWSACKAQLGNLNLADIATLPDSYDHNSDGSWSSHLHFANLPENATYFQLEDCVATDGCVVTAVYNYTYILYKAQVPVPNGICSNNSTASNMPEPCALSFLTHFVGDAHQPLHVSYEVDKGGNNFAVMYNGSSTDLHSIWDSSMIMTYEDEYLSPHTWEAFAQELIDVLNQHPEWQYFFANQSDPRAWANESFHYTRDNCYNMQPGTSLLGIVVSYPESFSPADIPMPPRLNPPAPVPKPKKSRSARSSSTCDCPVAGDAYFGRNIGIIKSRLMMAGMRLAGLLDAIYAANASRFVRGETHAREILQEFSVALKEFEAKRPGPEYAPEVYSCQH